MAWIQAKLYLVFFLVILVIAVWALIDLARRPARAFVAEGKRTKGLWGAILGAAVVVAIIAVPFGGFVFGGGLFQFLAVVAAIASIVYLVDVRPAVAPHTRRRGRGGSSRW